MGDVVGAAPVADMSLPLARDQVTAEWLTVALGFRYPGVEVISAEIEEVRSGASTKFFVRLEYGEIGQAAGLPPTLVVKGGFEDHSPAMAAMTLKEMRYYRDLQPILQLNAPECLYAGRDPDTHQSIVILEDLRARNVTFCDARRPQGYADVARRLEALALFHSKTWDSPELAPGGTFNWPPTRFEGSSLRNIERSLGRDNWQRFVEMPRAAAVPQTLCDPGRMRASLASMAQQHATEPTCLIHGDTHLGNLYVDPDGTPGFFDMQVSRAPWSLEVAYHIGCALDLADRAGVEQSLLTRYLVRLEALGVESVPDFETAWLQYRRDMLYGLYIFLSNETAWQIEAVNTAYAARFGVAVTELRTLDLLDASG